MIALLAAGGLVLTLGACSGDTPKDGATNDADQTYKIGITQLLAHPSLDLITQGFKDSLAEKNLAVEYVYEDAQGEQANTVTIAGMFAADSSLDLVVAIATGSAQAMVTAVRDRPVLYAGITDPVEAGLVASWDASGTNVTGTSDLNPEGRPAGLIQEIMGADSVKTIGYLYSLAEVNSVVQLDALKTEAEALGIAVKESGIANGSEMATGVQALTDVDAIYVGTDNTVVAGIEQVVAFCQEHQIPLFVGDAASVERGGVATRGIDYYELGKRTAEIAYDILVNGKNPGDIPQLKVTDTKIVVNPAAAASFGLTIPEAILEGADIVDSVS
jgi:putative ABC transport system substrate-binding protein